MCYALQGMPTSVQNYRNEKRFALLNVDEVQIAYIPKWKISSWSFTSSSIKPWIFNAYSSNLYNMIYGYNRRIQTNWNRTFTGNGHEHTNKGLWCFEQNWFCPSKLHASANGSMAYIILLQSNWDSKRWAKIKIIWNRI